MADAPSERRAFPCRLVRCGRTAECRGEVRHAGESVGGDALERAQHGRFDRRRHRRAHRADRPRRLGESARDDRLHGRSRERRVAGEHLVQDGGQRILVASLVEDVVARLLGAHVRRRADHDAGTRDAFGARVEYGLGDSKIRDVRVIAGEQQVLRLDVAMHHAALVRRLERGGRRFGDSNRVFDRQLALAVHALAKRLAGDVRHREPGQRLAAGSGADAGVEHRERCSGAGFAP